jgi:hypothetical protein
MKLYRGMSPSNAMRATIWETSLPRVCAGMRCTAQYVTGARCERSARSTGQWQACAGPQAGNLPRACLAIAASGSLRLLRKAGFRTAMEYTSSAEQVLTGLDLKGGALQGPSNRSTANAPQIIPSDLKPESRGDGSLDPPLLFVSIRILAPEQCQGARPVRSGTKVEIA